MFSRYHSPGLPCRPITRTLSVTLFLPSVIEVILSDYDCDLHPLPPRIAPAGPCGGRNFDLCLRAKSHRACAPALSCRGMALRLLRRGARGRRQGMRLLQNGFTSARRQGLLRALPGLFGSWRAFLFALRGACFQRRSHAPGNGTCLPPLRSRLGPFGWRARGASSWRGLPALRGLMAFPGRLSASGQ